MRQSSIMLLFLLMKIVGSSFLFSSVEVPGKTLRLTSEQSSVEFDWMEWDPKKRLTVATRFATRSVNGQLMLIKGVAQNTDETVFELSVVLKQRDLNIYLRDQYHSVVAQGENIKNNIATGEENSLILELSLVENRIGISHFRSRQTRIPIDKPIPNDQKMDIVIYFGSASDDSSDSIIGCVTLVAVFLDTASRFTVKTQSDDVFNDCKNLCDGYDCNGGSCVNKFSKPLCDCSETGHHGAQCQTASLPIAVASEQYIRYELDKNEHQPQRIAFKFKIGRGIDEGLLLHASVGSKKSTYTGTLSMELIYGDHNTSMINFRIADLITMNFSYFPERKPIFHDVEIKFNYYLNEVLVNMDGEPKTDAWKLTDATDQLIFSEAVYFGGSADEMAYGIGLNGCLNEPYVGIVAVQSHLDEAIDGNKVTSNGILETCNDDAFSGMSADEESVQPDEIFEELTDPANEQADAEEEDDDDSTDNELATVSTDDGDDMVIPTVSVDIATEGDEEDEEGDDKEERPSQGHGRLDATISISLPLLILFYSIVFL